MDPSVFVPFLEPTDFIALLPPKLARKVLSYLDAPSLLLAAQVSHAWNDATNDEYLWERLALDSGWTDEDVKSSGLGYKRFCMEQAMGWVAKPVTVLWASHSGLAKSLVKHLSGTMVVHDFVADIVPSLKDWDFAQLSLQYLVIFVFDRAAEEYDGIPAGARSFYKWVMSNERPARLLKNVKYTMFVQGDSRQHEFNKMTDMCARLDQLGATCVYELASSDAGDARSNPPVHFQRWCSRMLTFVERQRNAGTAGGATGGVGAGSLMQPSMLKTGRFNKDDVHNAALLRHLNEFDEQRAAMGGGGGGGASRAGLPKPRQARGDGGSGDGGGGGGGVGGGDNSEAASAFGEQKRKELEAQIEKLVRMEAKQKAMRELESQTFWLDVVIVSLVVLLVALLSGIVLYFYYPGTRQWVGQFIG